MAAADDHRVPVARGQLCDRGRQARPCPSRRSRPCVPPRPGYSAQLRRLTAWRTHRAEVCTDGQIAGRRSRLPSAPSVPMRFNGGKSQNAQDSPAQRHFRHLEPQRGGPGHRRPHRRRQQPLRRQRLHAGRAARAHGQRPLRGASAHAGRGRGPGAHPGRRGRGRDEGVGARARRHPLHPLVPAPDRLHRREARRLLRAQQRGRVDRQVLRRGADPGRARRVLVPDRRRPRHLRGPRLHRLGPDQPGLHPREPERGAALHPDRVRVVDGRGARRQDPAAALDGRAVADRDPRPAAAGRRRGQAGVHDRRPRAGVLPDRRAVLLRPARPGHHRPHPVRRQAAEGSRAGRPLLRGDPRARARLHHGLRERAREARACRSRPATTRSRPASTRSRRSTKTRTSAPITSS